MPLVCIKYFLLRFNLEFVLLAVGAGGGVLCCLLLIILILILIKLNRRPQNENVEMEESEAQKFSGYIIEYKEIRLGKKLGEGAFGEGKKTNDFTCYFFLKNLHHEISNSLQRRIQEDRSSSEEIIVIINR